MIKTKYNMGDSVWIIEDDYIYESCNICSNGKIYIKEETFNCPKCKGNVNGIWLGARDKVESYTIVGMEIYIETDSETVFYDPENAYCQQNNLYHISNSNFFDVRKNVKEHLLFPSEEEALKEASDKNSEQVLQLQKQFKLHKLLTEHPKVISNDSNQ